MEQVMEINRQEKSISDYEAEVIQLRQSNQTLEEENRTLQCKLNIAKEHNRHLERTFKQQGDINNRGRIVREISQPLSTVNSMSRPSHANQQTVYQKELKKKDDELNRLRKLHINHATEISNLKCQIARMSYANQNNSHRDCIYQLRLAADQAEKDLRKARKKYNTDLNAWEAQLWSTNISLGNAVKLIAARDKQIRLLNQQLNDPLNVKVVNFPNDLLGLNSEMKGTPECEPNQEESVFQKELARRITCKICLYDVERLRCSQCLKGICNGCHAKVKLCPNCRNEKNNFKHIIMSRL